MKYKYYFRKPKSEIVKDVFKILMWGGIICVASTSPYFIVNLKRGLKKWAYLKKHQNQYISNVFCRLRKEGLVRIVRKNKQIYISLTKEGKKKAGWLQIDALKIKKPKTWDKKWRLVMFDIAQDRKIYREALRGKLKELGFYPFQKSVWIHPYDCRDEVEVLKKFFGLGDDELQYVIAEKINQEYEWKRIFHFI